MLPPPNRSSRNNKGNPALTIAIVVGLIILINAASTVGAYVLVLVIPIGIIIAVTVAAVNAAKKQRPVGKPAAAKAAAKPAARPAADCPNPEPHRHYEQAKSCPNPEPHRHAETRYQAPKAQKAPRREYDTFVQPVKKWPTAAERRRENMRNLYDAGLLTREEYEEELRKLKALEV